MPSNLLQMSLINAQRLSSVGCSDSDRDYTMSRALTNSLHVTNWVDMLGVMLVLSGCGCSCRTEQYRHDSCIISTRDL